MTARTPTPLEASQQRCHLCRRFLSHPGDSSYEVCPKRDRLECSFIARGRLRVPLRVRLEIRARETKEHADREAERFLRVAEWLGDPARRNNSEQSERYRAYINSDEWQKKALARKQEAGFVCETPGCGATDDLDVHHTRGGYRRLGHELPGDLAVLCSLCHLEATMPMQAGRTP